MILATEKITASLEWFKAPITKLRFILISRLICMFILFKMILSKNPIINCGNRKIIGLQHLECCLNHSLIIPYKLLLRQGLKQILVILNTYKHKTTNSIEFLKGHLTFRIRLPKNMTKNTFRRCISTKRLIRKLRVGWI